MSGKYRRLTLILSGLLTFTLTGCSGPTDPDDPVEGVTLNGVDVSHHNIDDYASIDWTQVRDAGYVFAFVKATDGYRGCWQDPTFVTNMDSGYQAGMLMGAYHYARPDLNPDAADEARCFLSVAGPYLRRGFLRPVLDVETGEDLGKTALTDWIHVWMRTVKDRTSVEPIFYTYRYFTTYLDVSVTRYDFWLAHYTRTPTIMPESAGIWPDWAFWQYTDQGNVPGISDPTIDLNLFNGGLTELYNNFVIQ